MLLSRKRRAAEAAASKILVLLDMNGTLVYRAKAQLGGCPAAFTHLVGRDSRTPMRLHYYLRPHAMELVRFLRGHARVTLAFYTSMRLENALPAVEYVMRASDDGGGGGGGGSSGNDGDSAGGGSASAARTRQPVAAADDGVASEVSTNDGGESGGGGDGADANNAGRRSAPVKFRVNRASQQTADARDSGDDSGSGNGRQLSDTDHASSDSSDSSDDGEEGLEALIYAREYNAPDPLGAHPWSTKRDLARVWTARGKPGHGFGAANTLVIDDSAAKMRHMPHNVLAVEEYTEARAAAAAAAAAAATSQHAGTTGCAASAAAAAQRSSRTAPLAGCSGADITPEDTVLLRLQDTLWDLFESAGDDVREYVKLTQQQEAAAAAAADGGAADRLAARRIRLRVVA